MIVSATPSSRPVSTSLLFSSAHSDDLGGMFGESEIVKFSVLLCLQLVLRLRHSFVVIWGTSITVRQSLPGLTRCRGDDRRYTQIFLFMTLASLTFQVLNSRRFSRRNSLKKKNPGFFAHSRFGTAESW